MTKRPRLSLPPVTDVPKRASMQPVAAVALALLTCWSASGAARGQEAPASPPESAPAPAAPVAVQVFVFTAAGAPAAGIDVSVGAARAVTDAGGVAALTTSPGRHPLTLTRSGRVLAKVLVAVEAGASVEVLARLDASGEHAEVDVEGARLEAPAAPEATATPASPAAAPPPRPAGGGPSPAPGSPPTPSAAPPPAAALAVGAAPAGAAERLKPGTLAGTVTSEKDGRPVEGVRVLVRGSAIEARTGADGSFRLALPAGSHAISLVHPDYAAMTLADLAVAPGGTTTASPALVPSAVELESVTVSGYRVEGGLAALLEERREERAVTEILGSEQIAKSGDGDGAAALRRVTGLTVVGGRYVYVRGMGERYSTALLNGTTLPSPQPERRVVPLDMFPTDVIESIAVQKTYTPDLPGEFGGGAVKLRTRQIPKETVLTGSLTVGMNTRTTFRRGLTYDGGGTDLLGFDDGTRALPGIVEDAAAASPLFLRDPFSPEGYTLEELERFGEAMPNVWSAETSTIPPDAGLTVTYGDRVEVLGSPLGYLVSAIYDNGYESRDEVRRTFATSGDGSLTPTTDYDSRSTTHSVDTGAMLNLGWAPGGHQLEATGLLVRTTRDEVEVYEGLLADDNTDIRVTSLSWTEEMLLTGQLRGKHPLGPVDVAWSYAYALATRDQPDWRRSRYDQDPSTGIFRLSNRPEGNQRLFNEVADHAHDVGLTAEVPFGVWSDLEARLRVGGAFVHRYRDAETRRFKFIHRGPLSQDPNLLALPTPEQIFLPETVGATGFSFEEITRATDAYEAEQAIIAGFVALALPLHDRVDLDLGVRVESSLQEVATFNLFDRDGDSVRAELDETDLLPAINLTWRFVDDMQIRAGYSRTLSRPDFRELSSAPYDQVIGAGVFVGNPELERTVIDNLDVRWEWYFSTDEHVSLGVFAKLLHDPIESVVLGGANRTTTLDNADRGTNMGIEVDFRKSFRFLGDLVGVEALRQVYLAGNVALIRSEVDLGRTGVATEDERPLAGQSEYVVNLALGYDDPDSGIAVTLLYNVYGERISEVGTFGLPDIEEQPFHQLDLVASWTPVERWRLSVKLQNLLDDEVRFEQKGEVTRAYRRGMGVAFGLTVSY